MKIEQTEIFDYDPDIDIKVKIPNINKWRWYLLGKNTGLILDVPWNISWWQRLWLKILFKSEFEKIN